MALNSSSLIKASDNASTMMTVKARQLLAGQQFCKSLVRCAEEAALTRRDAEMLLKVVIGLGKESL